MFSSKLTKGAVAFELALVLLPLCGALISDYNRRENIAESSVFPKQETFEAYLDVAPFQLMDPIALGNFDHLPANQLHRIPSNCTLFIPRIFANSAVNLELRGPFLHIKAYCENLGLLDFVLAPTTKNTDDMRVVFDVDNTEYIILNYLYVKIIFAGLFITTGLLVAVEIRDIYEKFKLNRRNKQFVRLIEDDV
ncbi:unnamed protein product [Phyllotreta striolata]|uniref:Uncharacterized protein n=1 Tax=Phyllotreta striolata TaxID=444603 RepID=A0A9N9TFG0_PHYSR|nr:unnamed protein product [Phyllotreta striolata]